MKKKSILILFLLCFFSVAGWNFGDTYIAKTGNDDFDKAFWTEFDSEHIIDHMDELAASGLFDCVSHGEYSSSYTDSIYLPAGDRTDSPHKMQISKNIRRDEQNISYSLRWQKYNNLSPQTAEEAGYRYRYLLSISAPNGDILYSQEGNSRRECMEKMRENLLWLMSLC